MSGLKGTSLHSSENSTLSAVQKLIFSVGHLKFSMRAISSMQLQSALLSLKGSESPSHLTPLESSRLLESIINDISVKKPDHCRKNNGVFNTDQVQSSITINDLEIVQKKLQEEFEKKRQNYLDFFLSKQCNL